MGRQGGCRMTYKKIKIGRIEAAFGHISGDKDVGREFDLIVLTHSDRDHEEVWHRIIETKYASETSQPDQEGWEQSFEQNLYEWHRVAVRPLTPAVKPPCIPEFLLVLMATTAQREAAVGDLNEMFERDCETWGQSRAERLYWAGAIRSLWPLLLRAMGRAVKWATIVS